jgi:hypothetical protein
MNATDPAPGDWPQGSLRAAAAELAAHGFEACPLVWPAFSPGRRARWPAGSG